MVISHVCLIIANDAVLGRVKFRMAHKSWKRLAADGTWGVITGPPQLLSNGHDTAHRSSLIKSLDSR